MKKSGIIIGIAVFLIVTLLGVTVIEYLALQKNKEYAAGLEDEIAELEASAGRTDTGRSGEDKQQTETQKPGEEGQEGSETPETGDGETPDGSGEETGSETDNEEDEDSGDDADVDDDEDSGDEADVDDDDDDEEDRDYDIQFSSVRLIREDGRYTNYAIEGNPYDEMQYRYESMISYPTDIVFLGDSLTNKGLWEEFYPEYIVKNRGISGDTIEGVAARLESVFATKPDRIFLMIGVNDIMFGRLGSGKFENDYDGLLRELTDSDAEIYVMSILPVGAQAEESFGSELNSWIREANGMIAEMCEDHGAHYIDVRDGFSDGAGRLRDELTYDGIHLTGEGYEIWKENLDEYIY